jgi:Cu-processing system ATP-binding protein
MSEPLIRLEGVSKRFGTHWAVRNVDLALHGGESVGLVGHNGAGKTTLIKLMLGLVRPSEGIARVLGEDPASGHAIARRALGYLPENVAFHPSMTGEETLILYARLKRQDRRCCAALLERVGLAAAARRRVGTYSKGMRQRLGLAQALLGNSRALLLDEPTTGMDPALRQSFYAILRELRDAGAAVLLSSHALAEMEGEVDRVVVINRGRKVADGSIAELRRLTAIRPRLRVRLMRAPRAVANGGDPWAMWRRMPGDVLEVECDEGEIMALLRGLPAGVQDIDIIRPSLDAVYAAFLRDQVAQ